MQRYTPHAMRNVLDQLRERFAQLSRHRYDDPDTPSRLREIFPFFVILLLVIGGIWIVWTVPHTVIQHRIDATHPLALDKQLELEDAFRKTLSQIVLSLFGLLILYFTWRRARAGDATVRIMEQGHITDRFTKAIEQLGKTDGDKPNIEVRLGAIYALERIAFDSPRDHWTIVGILTAYVRQNAPLRPDAHYVEGEQPRTDIQAVLTVLGRRVVTSRREQPRRNLDLSSSCLNGAILFEANLQKVNFRRAQLNGINLNSANVTGSSFRECHLEHADFRDAQAQTADFGNSMLRGSIFLEADLRKANIYGANLQRANLSYARLQEARFTESDLTDADLSGALLEGASLFRTKLQDAIGLQAVQIKLAVRWKDAHYSPAFRAELGLPPEATETSPHPYDK